MKSDSTSRSKIYFASDVHLGSKYHKDAQEIEKKFARWLHSIKEDAYALFLVGDIFDYWFEYKYVVPKGHIRFLGALAELADSGVQIHIFTGNHDVWMFGYLSDELGAKIYKQPTILTLGNKQFYIAHGDEMDDRKRSFRILRKIFHNKMCQRLYAMIHPYFTVGFATAWSLHSRKKGLQHKTSEYEGEQNEYLVKFAKSYLKDHNDDIDFFVFGHRHILLDLLLNRRTRIVILGDWLSYFSYGVFDINDGSFYVDQFEIEEIE